MGLLSDVIETAAGWAIAAVAIYGLLFVDLTGNGRLWDALRGVAQDSVAVNAAKNGAVQMRAVPVRPPDLDVKAQNHMLVMPEVPDQEIQVPVYASAQTGAGEQLTDSPADTHAGKNWHKHLNGEMRKFTVYGKGEERSSASASVGSAPAASAAPTRTVTASAPTPSVAVSAYNAGAAAEARPGISDHVMHVSDGAKDGVRNIR